MRVWSEHGTAADARRARAGLTLLELLLVMGLLGLLLGAGVGVLASLNLGERAAVGLVQNTIRSARNSALARGAGARVRIDPNQGVLVAEAMSVIGTWHFESAPTLMGAFELDGAGRDTVLVDDGFVGKALGFPVRPRASASVAVQNDPSYDLREGFRVEFALQIDEDGAGRVLRLGESVAIDAAGSGLVRGWILPEVIDQTGRPMKGGKIVVESQPRKLAKGEWRRIALDYDRQRLALEIDGIEVMRAEASAPVWPLGDDLRLGDDRTGFAGALDSLVISAVSASEEVRMPEGVRIAPDSPAVIRFDAGGSLDREAHPEPLEVRLVFESDGSVRTVRVGMYGTVE